MPIAQTQVDTVAAYVGPGTIYWGVTEPANGSFLVVNSSGVPATGTDVGLTSDAVEFDYTPTLVGTKVEQALGEIAPRVNDEKYTCKFNCAEPTANRMAYALQAGGTSSSVAGTAGVPTENHITVGGMTTVSPTCVAIVSSAGSYVYMSATTKLWEVACLYKVVGVGFKRKFKRGDTRMVEVNLVGYADVTRTEGDQLFAITTQADPN